MKNRMQDLDFEQTVAFDSVKDFEFTRRAAQRFRQVVSLDGFEDDLAVDGEDPHLVVLPEPSVDDGTEDDGSDALDVEVAVHRAGSAGAVAGLPSLGLGEGDELLPQLDGVLIPVLVVLQARSGQEGLQLLGLLDDGEI